jgi:Arc/MetJ-type ribon-helix-helix transcriptional regulator
MGEPTSVRLPEGLRNDIDEIVENGSRFEDRSDAMVFWIRQGVQREERFNE